MQTDTATVVAGIERAVSLLRAGKIVAFPTETVYGLGADARSDAAIRRIYDAKGRPSGNPLIVHVASIEAARAAAGGWNDRAEALARRFWPGPLTVIVPRGRGISPLVSAGRETVALRCPHHPVATSLLNAFGGPIAAPSANRSGFTSPTTAAHVLAELDGRVPLILDGGPCAVGVESTVVDTIATVPRILRPGAVTAEMLREVVGPVESVTASVSPDASADSPGQHAAHYAPRTQAYRFRRAGWSTRGVCVKGYAGMIKGRQGRVALLTYDPRIFLKPPHETILMPADAEQYAQRLYAALREADDMHPSSILVLLPDESNGLWAAVSDRLIRATSLLPIM